MENNRHHKIYYKEFYIEYNRHHNIITNSSKKTILERIQVRKR